MKKLDKKLLENLKEKLSPEELSTDTGNFDRTKNKKPNRKARRHSGRKEVFIDDEDYPYQEMFYDDWSDYRDGQRAGWEIGYLEKKEKEKRTAKLKKFKKKIKKEIGIKPYSSKPK